MNVRTKSEPKHHIVTEWRLNCLKVDELQLISKLHGGGGGGEGNGGRMVEEW